MSLRCLSGMCTVWQPEYPLFHSCIWNSLWRLLVISLVYIYGGASQWCVMQHHPMLLHNQLKPKHTTTPTSGTLRHRYRPHPAA